jgi:hypothetical protein
MRDTPLPSRINVRKKDMTRGHTDAGASNQRRGKEDACTEVRYETDISAAAALPPGSRKN